MASCSEMRCDAASLGGDRCLGHATKGELAVAIARWRDGAELDAQRAYLDAQRIQLFLSVLSRDDSKRLAQPLQSEHRPAFCGAANFKGATFASEVDFGGITFEGPVYFDGARFLGTARFAEAQFKDHADFDNASFEGLTSFRGVTFHDHAGFQHAKASTDVIFASAVFENNVDVEGAYFEGQLDIREATFQFARILGPFRVGGDLNFDDCVFSERVRLDVIAPRVLGSFAIFVEGGRISVTDADIVMDGTNFGRATTLSGRTTPNGEAVVRDTLQAPPPVKTPRLLTLRGAQVSSLSISGLDLKDCHFFGAHGLESLVIEPSCQWRHTPRKSRCIDREIILEEEQWRASAEFSKLRSLRWAGRFFIRPLWTSSDKDLNDQKSLSCLEPNQLAALYRALRKAREDNKDQAGAGDLYYGEMEMRRRVKLPHGRGRLRAISDKAIITAYWLVSGYGLRASRAFAVWIALVLTAAPAMTRWGIEPTSSLGRGALFSFESTSSLIRLTHLPHGYALTPAGEILQVGLRLIGPILIGLLLLALRARVKR